MLGVPLALVLARLRGRTATIVRTIVLLPLVLPPVIGGIALLYAFGRRGLLGSQLELLGIPLAFTTAAVVIAQTFVSLPFLVVAVEGALRSARPDDESVAATLGARPGTVLRRITLPLALPALVSGTILAFARALGEFDRFGRTATDLRVSLTDRCNLRCTYCMPASGIDPIASPSVLTGGEVIRLVRIAVERLGVTSVRFTGGEPLLRHDLVEIVAQTAGLRPRPDIALTTNAIGLAERAAALASAGLDRVNVSLDSLDAATYARVTRRPLLHRALAGIDAARAAGLGVKVNAVLVPGVNEHEAADLLAWALDAGVELRFIEQMPVGGERSWQRDVVVTAADTRALLSERFALAPHAAPRGGAPAERFDVREHGAAPDDPARGTVGIIASVTEPFCGDCRRTRLTADGAVRDCLFAHDETPLRDLIVLPTDVVDAVDGCSASDAGVGSMVIVVVQPGVVAGGSLLV